MIDEKSMKLIREIAENHKANGNPDPIEKIMDDIIEDWETWDEFIIDMLSSMDE